MNMFSINLRKRIIAAVMGVMLCFGMVFSSYPAQTAHAQVSDGSAEIAQQMQILQLMILLRQLQAQLQALLAERAGIVTEADEDEDEEEEMREDEDEEEDDEEENEDVSKDIYPEDTEGVASLLFSLSSDNPDSSLLKVEEDDESDEYTVLGLEVEERNGVDVVIEELILDVDIENSNASADDIIDEAILMKGSTELSEGDVSSRGLITFEDVELELEGDSSEEIEVRLVFNGAEDYGSGTQIRLKIYEGFGEAEDENGNDEGDMFIGIGARGDYHTLATNYVGVFYEDTDIQRNASSTGGIISFEFTIASDEEDYTFEVNDKSNVKDEGTVRYSVSGPNKNLPRASMTLVSGDADSTRNGWVIEEGAEATFVIDFEFYARSNSDAGTYRVTLDSIAGVSLDERSSGLSLVSESSIIEDKEEEEVEERAEYRGYMDGRNFIITRNISEDDALDNCELNARNNPAREVYCTWDGDIIFDNRSDEVEEPAEPVMPEENKMACDRNNNGSIDDGEFACYGIWDYGNDFGGDQDMCGGYADFETGCVIEAPVCESGQAEATFAKRPSSLSSSETRDAMSRLDVSEAALDEGLATLYEYTCVAGASEGPEGKIYGIGVYEGSYPDGVRHSGGFHPQGSLDVEVEDVESGSVLVLTSYEPIKWNLTGSDLRNVDYIMTSGYYEQEVSGNVDAEIISSSYEEGDRDYFFTYQSSGSRYNEVNDAVEDEFGRGMDYFQGQYAGSSFTIDGTNPVQASSGGSSSSSYFDRYDYYDRGGDFRSATVITNTVNSEAQLASALSSLYTALEKLSAHFDS